jgi:hypothetical protein
MHVFMDARGTYMHTCTYLYKDKTYSTFIYIYIYVLRTHDTFTLTNIHLKGVKQIYSIRQLHKTFMCMHVIEHTYIHIFIHACIHTYKWYTLKTIIFDPMLTKWHQHNGRSCYPVSMQLSASICCDTALNIIQTIKEQLAICSHQKALLFFNGYVHTFPLCGRTKTRLAHY